MTALTPDAQADGNQAAPDPHRAASPGRIRTLWNAAVAGIAVMMGILPHVLHHIGLLAGTALIAGAGGTVLFGLIGLAASVPFLIKLYRRSAPGSPRRSRWWSSSSCSRFRPSSYDRRSAAPTAPHPLPFPHPTRPRRPGRRSTTRDTTQRDDHGCRNPACDAALRPPGNPCDRSPQGGSRPTESRCGGSLAVDRSTDPDVVPLAPSSNLHCGNGRGFTHGPHAER